METLKKLLSVECHYRLSDELADEFLNCMTEIRLQSKDILISYGQFDDNVYLLKTGIIRYCYFDGMKEKTFGFVVPGSMMMQYHCYYERRPSFFQLEVCCESVVMKISKKQLDDLIERSHEFAKWMLTMSLGQLYTNEMKLSIINGTAKERLNALIQRRPEIIALVPLKVVASYLGVTPAYLSRMRKALVREK